MSADPGFDPPTEPQWVVARRTLSTGRVWYVSAVSGVGWTGSRSKARRFNREHADRWADMEARDIARGVGGQVVFVEPL